MAFTWYGNDNETVWESSISRYYFVSSQTVEINMPYGGKNNHVKVGTRFKIKKSEAAKFSKKGYLDYVTSSWNEDKAKWDRITVQLQGRIEKQVETRVCRNAPITAEEFSHKKK